jgi:aminoglycoside phosphotransferase (APT) family kinase protein
VSGAGAAAQDPRVRMIAAELGLERAIVTPLPGGLANRTLRLQDARHDYVLRLAGAAGGTLRASREHEFAMLHLAAAAGLAPGIVLARPADGFIVTRHVAGRVPEREDLRDPAFLRRVGAWIASLHALPPPPLPPIDFAARAAAYLDDLRTGGGSAEVAAIARRLAARRAELGPAARLAACHHDLHHRNFVDTGRALVVLDWEYAGPGDPAADLAACIGYHRLGRGAIEALLSGYGEDGAALRGRLAALGWIFDCLWYGWNGVAALAGLEVDGSLQDRLAARLAA